MITVLAIIGGLVLAVFLWSNISVWRANRKFYKALISKGYSEYDAKMYMQEENRSYQMIVSTTGGNGLMLKHWLEEVINKY